MKRESFLKKVEFDFQVTPIVAILGPRQCGKTTSLRAFGQQCFEQYHYFNFEKQQKLHGIFTGDLEPVEIIDALNFHTDATINVEQDLVIFDEIQA